MLAPGDEQIVADRVRAILSTRRTLQEAPPPAAPAGDVTGQWQVAITCAASSSTHVLQLRQHGDKVDGSHILSCLTDDIEWTVFGAFHLTGKNAYDKAIDGAPHFIDPPELSVVRMVEQGVTVMAELTGVVRRAEGGEMRLSMAEVFVMRNGRIAERRAWVTPLNENDNR